MIVTLVIISTFALTNALQPVGNVELADDKTRDIISKYISKIPDIEEQYIVDNRLTEAISRYFHGKISSFPLYKVSLKIDRNPIKIPWTIVEPNLDKTKVKKPNFRIQKQEDKPVKKEYKHVKIPVNKKSKKTNIALPETSSVGHKEMGTKMDTSITNSGFPKVSMTTEAATINTIL